MPPLHLARRARGSTLGTLVMLAGFATVLASLGILFRTVVDLSEPSLVQLYGWVVVFFAGVFLLGVGFGRRVRQ